MEPETDDIILQEEVEVNETPGIVQSGGGTRGKEFYTDHSSVFREVFHNGYVVENTGLQKSGEVGTSIPKQVKLKDDLPKENLLMYLAPIRFYFSPRTYDLYPTYEYFKASTKNTDTASYWYFSKYKFDYVPNLFDKIIFDLLKYANTEAKAKNWDNVKAYCSIIARLYCLFVITVFQGQFLEATRLRTTDPLQKLPEKKVYLSQFVSNKKLMATNYDLFNALEILTALGFFGEDSVLLNESMTTELQVSATPDGPTDRDKATKNISSWPENAPVNPKFPTLTSTPLPTKLTPNPTAVPTPFTARTIWGGVWNLKTEKEEKNDEYKDLRTISPTDPKKVGKENLTYYMLEDAYLYITTCLYTMIGLNDIEGQDEVKTYKEFRNTKEFLKAMPGIIDQAFRSQAVSAAKGTVGDPILIADKFMETLFTFLQSGDNNNAIQGDAAKKQTFDTLVGELNTNKTALLDPANKQKLEDVGFDQTKFDAIKDSVTAGAAGPAAATLADLQTVITTKEYYERIKTLAQEIATAEKKVPGLEADYQAKVQVLTDIQTRNPANQFAIAEATTARDAALTELTTAKGVYNANRTKIFNIIQAIDNKATRFAEPPLSDYSKYDAFTKIVAYQPPNFNAQVNPINAARNAILDIADAALQALVPVGDELATVAAANTAIDVYRQRFLPLRNTLIEAYKTYRAQFEPTSTYKNPEYKKILDDAIQLIETTAPLNEKLADDAFADTPPVPGVAGVAAVAATPLTIVQKTAKVTPILDTLKENVLALKRLLKPDTQVPVAGVAGVVVAAPALIPGLPDTTPAGALHEVPAVGTELIQKPFINQLISATTTGGSKRKTRRNRNRKNINTRRNNEMI